MPQGRITGRVGLDRGRFGTEKNWDDRRGVLRSKVRTMSMGKREKPQPVSWKSQLSPPSSHLSIVIAYFFYRCTAVRTSSNSSVSPEIAIRATMNNDRSSGGSSNGTTPPPSAGNDHEVAPPPPYPTFGGLLDAEVSFDGEQGGGKKKIQNQKRYTDTDHSKS